MICGGLPNVGQAPRLVHFFGGSHMTRTRLLTAVAAIAALFAASVTMAQGPTSEVARARDAYRNNGAARAVESARGYTYDYRQYAKAVPTVEPTVARDAADAIGDYITKAEKHFGWMRTEASKTGDKTSLASLDVIDKNLADAKKAHKEMHEICLKATIDKAASMACCEQIDDSLAKVISEHDKLMKRLGLPNPPPAASTK
jgi:hypothetical protein